MNQNPILNNPYNEPLLHYHTNDDGELDYTNTVSGRRVFRPDRDAMPTRQKHQKKIFDENAFAQDYENHLVNLIRNEIEQWRKDGYPNTTRVTKELLDFWFNNPERHAIKKLFYAQKEAIETAIWINEIANRTNPGQNILNQLKLVQQTISQEPHEQLPRIAFKMATGTGKTVVMATLIVYHYFNRQEYRQDTRFADYFLIVAPGITIKDRLGVLFVDKKSKNKNTREDYYAIRDIVPQSLESKLDNINAKLIITNYHSFEPRTLKGNKRSPMDGKIIGKDENGKDIKQVAKEDFSQVVKRLLGKFKVNTRLLIFNDEAHHCYLPKKKGRTKDTEGDENAKAAVWFTGLSELSRKFKLSAVYDLSATPYYLTGSGYEPYSLFGWVVSDFGLIEAIESGLVKIPFLPEKDNTQDLTMPILRNLYDHVKDELPKKGQRKRKKEAKEEGKKLSEEPPRLPRLVKGALDQFYTHYDEYNNLMREKSEDRASLFSKPPVFIAVCNNTSVSKEVYKYIAGYEYADENGELRANGGAYDLFSNYDESGRLKRKSPTLLIDSEALDDADQVNADFKKIFKSEIGEFKSAYARLHGQGSTEKITDAELLREVVNTVGQTGKLGGHIRCVVSVSMLTEGWDANTVTHIMGLRAFGSQLLCEQVAGRALRRMDYYLQGYDKDGNPTSDKRKIVIHKYPPEYAHIIGVPFKMFKGGTSSPVDPPDYTQIKPISEKQDKYEIEFPNIAGYRVEYEEDEILYDFTEIEKFEIDGSKFPIATEMATAFSDKKEILHVSQVLEKRENEIIYSVTKELLKYHFSDDDGNPNFQKFNQLKEIVQYWYDNKIDLLNIQDDNFKKLIYLWKNPKTIVDHINRGINPQINTSEFIKPVFNYYNKFGSTKYVGGNTSKEVYPTEKSHINYVVMDSGWEGICAKTLEELDNVESYVKNHFLGFAIPYVKDGNDKDYFTDFIARVNKPNGDMINLMIEITGMNKDKKEKKWFVENRWLPAVNAVKDKYEYDEWHFIEIANDIRNIKNELIDKINSL